MSLKEKINNDILGAMKKSDSETVSVLRFLSSVVKNKELEKRTKLSKTASLENLDKLSELNDEEIEAVIASEIKKRKDSIVQYEKGGRTDLSEKEKIEIEILKKYVSEEISESELKVIIKEKIASLGKPTIKDFGRIMGLIKSEVKNRADGEKIKKMIEEELQ